MITHTTISMSGKDFPTVEFSGEHAALSYLDFLTEDEQILALGMVSEAKGHSYKGQFTKAKKWDAYTIKNAKRWVKVFNKEEEEHQRFVEGEARYAAMNPMSHVPFNLPSSKEFFDIRLRSNSVDATDSLDPLTYFVAGRLVEAYELGRNRQTVLQTLRIVQISEWNISQAVRWFNEHYLTVDTDPFEHYRTDRDSMFFGTEWRKPTAADRL